jgi:phage terminase large subunit GpA-like protein
MTAILDAMREAWAPPEELTVDQWAAQRRVLTTRAGASRPGPWRNEVAPYLVEPMAVRSDPAVRMIVAMWGAQLGKTEALIINPILYSVECDPGPMLVVLPNDDAVNGLVKDRYRPSVEDNPSTQRFIGEKKTSLGAKSFQFTNCSLAFASSNSPSDLASRPIRDVYVDEADKCGEATRGNEGDWLKLATTRTTTFWNRKITICSTPNLEGNVTHRHFLLSDRREWFVPCQSCGEFFCMKAVGDNAWTKLFGGFMDRPQSFTRGEWARAVRMGHYFEDGKRIDITPYYACPHCGHRHMEHDKHALNNGGRWIATADFAGIAGFHLSTLTSSVYPWNELAADWVLAQESQGALQEFVNQRLGEPWRAEATRSSEADVLARVNHTLKRRVVPAAARFITLGVDVQQDRFPWSLWAWDAERRGHMIDAGNAASWDDLVDILQGEYPVDATDRKMTVAGGFIDSGFDQRAVYEFCALNRPLNIHPSKGTDSRINAAVNVSKVAVAPSRVNPKAGEIDLYTLNVSAFKDRLWELFKGSALSFHASTNADFASEFTSEERAEVPDKKKGFVKVIWRVKGGGQRGNHAWDTAVYAFAAAEILGGMARSAMRATVEKRAGHPAPSSTRPKQGGQSQWVRKTGSIRRGW